MKNRLFQNYIDQSYDTFISHVAEGRHMTKAQVDSIAQGRVWSGENAKEIGLVDEFGGLDVAIKRAAEKAGLEDYRTVSLPELPDPIQELFKSGASNVRATVIEK